MKKVLYSLILLAVGFNAAAQDTPQKIYLLGGGKVNGQSISWATEDIDNVASVDVIDGCATCVFTDITEGWDITITTATPQEITSGDWGSINGKGISPSNMLDFSDGQTVIASATMKFPAMGANANSWEVKFTDNLTKATVRLLDWDKKLYGSGWDVNVNDATLNWNSSENQAIEPIDGYFTANVSVWNGQLAFTPTTSSDFGKYTLSPAQVTTIGDRPMPSMEYFNQPQATMIGDNKWFYAPYLNGSFIVKVKEDLSTVEFMVAPDDTRKIQLEVRDGGFWPADDDIHVYDMATEDGIHYTMEIDTQKAIPAGSVVSVITTPDVENTSATVWRANANIVFGEKTNWITQGGETKSTVTSEFTGKITATVPGMKYFAGGTAEKPVNLYWSETPDCPVMFEYIPSTETGTIGIETEGNMPVEFYNLQGIRVAQPENGVFIRRQGSEVKKVIVK